MSGWTVLEFYKLYIVQVFTKDGMLEYESSDLRHARELAASEDGYNIYGYGVNGGMTLIETNIKD